MVIEFVGAPGCGKSFFGNKLVDELIKSGNKSINVVDISRSKLIYRILFRVLRYASKYSPYNRKLKKKLSEIVVDYLEIKASYNIVFIKCYIDTIAFYSYVYKLLYNRKGIYIFDEGIMQQIANITVNYGISNECIENILRILPIGAHVIRMQRNVKDIMIAIDKRNRHVCYIDELKGEILKEFLDKYIRSCNYLSELTDAVLLCQNDEIDKNIKMVRNLLEI